MRAIIGPNGAGKTTMMDIITGKTRPDEGDVLFDGSVDLTKLDEADIALLGIGRKFQKPTVFESHTVATTLNWRWRDRGFATLFTATTAEQGAHRRDARNHPPRRTGAATWPPTCRTARNSGWRSACCWRRTPKLLLVDEPVAGMTDARR
jgi:urea transport system ATP-binding protein